MRTGEGGTGRRGYMYNNGWFALLYCRNQHNIIKIKKTKIQKKQKINNEIFFFKTYLNVGILCNCMCNYMHICVHFCAIVYNSAIVCKCVLQMFYILHINKRQHYFYLAVREQ